MSARAANPLPRPLRVLVTAEPARRAEFEGLMRNLGHLVVSSAREAQVILADETEAKNGTAGLALSARSGGAIRGSLPREASPEQIDAALRAVAAGLVVTVPDGRQKAFGALDEFGKPILLTPRETEVLSAVSSGQTNKEIARDLGISLHTVKFHIESLMRKLGASTRTEAVSRALSMKLLEPFRM